MLTVCCLAVRQKGCKSLIRMLNQFSRSELIYGREAIERLKRSRVAVFGVGGVGGYVVEALVRSGVGTLDIIDNDDVSLTNINRQLIATHETIGMSKVDIGETRIHQINPDCIVNKHKVFYLPETSETFDFSDYDYVVDAIDTVSAKLDIIEKCKTFNIPIISSMGCGNRIDPTRLEIADISKTHMDPLAKVIRKGLKGKRIKHVKVVFSTEAPIVPIVSDGEQTGSTGAAGRQTPGSTPFVPAAAGLIIASEVVRDLTDYQTINHLKGPAKR